MIPPDIEREVRAYVAGNHPHPFGSFVTAILANDFVGAFMHADDQNRARLFEYASYLYNDMPGRTGDPESDYWGSYECVRNRITEQRAMHAAKSQPPVSA